MRICKGEDMVYIPIIEKKLDISDIEKSIKIYDNDVVYIGGSLVEGMINERSFGMGNIYSDIDLFIIRDKKYYDITDGEYDFNGVKSYFVNISGMNIDIEVYDRNEVENIVNSINSISFDSNKRTENILNTTISLFDVNSFLCRLFNSIPLKNQVQYLDLRDTINSEKFFELYANHTINKIQNIIEDTKGNKINQQYDVSLYSIRAAFLEYLKVYIMNYKEFIDRDKWVFLKMMNISSSNNDTTIIEIYNRLFCSDLSSDEKKENIINDSLIYIQEKIESYSLRNLAI